MVIRRWILAVLLAGLALLVVSPSASAEPDAPCSTTVIDQTDDHLFDVERLTSAARDMGNRTGLDVYVRAFQTTPYGDAGVWWRAAYKECPSWLATDGATPKPNVLVIAVGMDRKSSIEYGSGVHKLDDEIDSIRGKTLGNALRDAWSAPAAEKHEAFTSAVEKTIAELEAEYTKPPFDWGNVWAWVLKVLLAIGGIVSAVLATILTRTGIRKHRDKARARAEMLAAKAVSVDAVLGAESALQAHFIEADSAMEGVEGVFIALPSKESIAERVNAASSAHYELSSDPSPTSIDKFVAARNTYVKCAADIKSALRDAEARTDSIRARAEECTDESKDRDLRASVDYAARKLTELTAGTPKWLTTTSLEAILADAIRTGTSLIGASAPRADVDRSVEELSRACTNVDLARTGAKSAEQSIAMVVGDIALKINTYSKTVPDVAKATADTTLAALKALSPKAAGLSDEVSRGNKPFTPEGIANRVSSLRAELSAAMRAADAEIAAAERKREDERRKREEAERAARRKRDEEEAEERRRQSSSYGGGFGAGYYSGGGGGGGFGGGGDFGGGSAGGW